MIIVVCPGQGSQTPGFLEPWIADSGAKALLESLSDASGVDLVKHGTVSDADTIRDTQIAQPLSVAAGILTLDALADSDHLAKTGGIAGHSVGEFTAATGSGLLDAQDNPTFLARQVIFPGQKKLPSTRPNCRMVLVICQGSNGSTSRMGNRSIGF
jgi:[acyl-carrier-protein] S-malonyltransferase